MLWLTWKAKPERFGSQCDRQTTKGIELKCPKLTFWCWSTSVRGWGWKWTLSSAVQIVLTRTDGGTPGHLTLSFVVDKAPYLLTY